MKKTMMPAYLLTVQNLTQVATKLKADIDAGEGMISIVDRYEHLTSAYLQFDQKCNDAIFQIEQELAINPAIRKKASKFCEQMYEHQNKLIKILNEIADLLIEKNEVISEGE